MLGVLGCAKVFLNPVQSVCFTCDTNHFHELAVDGKCACLEGHLAERYCTTIPGCISADNGTDGVVCVLCNLELRFKVVNGTCECIQYYERANDECVEVCGDGFLISLPCDDGNNINNDGCSSTCEVETNYRCIREGIDTFSSCVFAAEVTLVL